MLTFSLNPTYSRTPFTEVEIHNLYNKYDADDVSLLLQKCFEGVKHFSDYNHVCAYLNKVTLTKGYKDAQIVSLQEGDIDEEDLTKGVMTLNQLKCAWQDTYFEAEESTYTLEELAELEDLRNYILCEENIDIYTLMYKIIATPKTAKQQLKKIYTEFKGLVKKFKAEDLVEVFYNATLQESTQKKFLGYLECVI